MNYELIESYQEVVDNVRRFNRDLETGEDIRSQLSQFRAWYYIPELDAFGPSKFIGYKRMNTSQYQRGYEKDGRETEPRLQKLFERIRRGHPRYAYLDTELHGLLALYGKKPNKRFRINVPRGF
jgi:hypothetical protein